MNRPDERLTGNGPTGASTSGVHGSGPMPLLASEALRDELAPHEPWRLGARRWSIALGLVFIALAVVPAYMMMPGDPWGYIPHLALGLASVLAGALPLGYGGRALLMVLVCASCGLLGVSGAGPAGAIADAVGEWGLLHLLAATGLPGALFFRARYRAYSGARYILATALTLASPLVVYALLTFSAGPLFIKITSVFVIAAMGLSLLGFMGTETSITASYVAALIMAAATAQLGSIVLMSSYQAASTVQLVWQISSLIAFGAATILGAVGVFQLLARRHWELARDVDVRKPKTQRPPMPSLGDDPWSTRK